MIAGPGLVDRVGLGRVSYAAAVALAGQKMECIGVKGLSTKVGRCGLVRPAAVGGPVTSTAAAERPASTSTRSTEPPRNSTVGAASRATRRS